MDEQVKLTNNLNIKIHTASNKEEIHSIEDKHNKAIQNHLREQTKKEDELYEAEAPSRYVPTKRKITKRIEKESLEQYVREAKIQAENDALNEQLAIGERFSKK